MQNRKNKSTAMIICTCFVKGLLMCTWMYWVMCIANLIVGRKKFNWPVFLAMCIPMGLSFVQWFMAHTASESGGTYEDLTVVFGQLFFPLAVLLHFLPLQQVFSCLTSMYVFIVNIPLVLWQMFLDAVHCFLDLPFMVWSWIVLMVSQTCMYFSNLLANVCAAFAGFLNFFVSLPSILWRLFLDALHIFANLPNIFWHLFLGFVNFFLDLPLVVWNWIVSMSYQVLMQFSNLLGYAHAACVNVLNFLMNLPNIVWKVIADVFIFIVNLPFFVINNIIHITSAFSSWVVDLSSSVWNSINDMVTFVVGIPAAITITVTKMVKAVIEGE